jgi:hypothetical protein
MSGVDSLTTALLESINENRIYTPDLIYEYVEPPLLLRGDHKHYFRSQHDFTLL